jgi:hypothetical protein
LRGEFDAIQVEPPGISAEGAEFRLFGEQPAGVDEVHQCKRRHASSWTVRELDRAGVLAPFGRHLADGVRVVFCSGTGSVLLGMAEKARGLALTDWLASLSNVEAQATDELARSWEVGDQEIHDRLTRLRVQVVDEVSLRAASLEYLAVLLDGDPEAALLSLMNFLLDNLMVWLTGQQVWNYLRTRGFSPRQGQDLALSEQVLGLRDRYIDGITHVRPGNLPLLARPEIDEIVQALVAAEGPRIVAVTGEPGSGKSTVLSEVCRRLAEKGIVVGPLRLDAAVEAWTAEQLGRQPGIGFGGPPARIVARAAGGGPAVLVVDQLDALSVLAGKGETVLDGVREMLSQAQMADNVRVLIACRSHDLSHDRRLRQLIHVTEPDGTEGAPRNTRRFAIGDLSQEQVRHALTALGVPALSMSPRLEKLLASPFNLSLLASILSDAHSAGFDLSSVRDRIGLLVEYDRRVGLRLRSALGNDGYVTAVHNIARLLSESDRISLPRTAVTDIPDTVDALLHEGVLATDGYQLRFFHDEYFDFVFARQHIQNGSTAASLIHDDIQDLSRRRQVTAILTLERQGDQARYLADLRATLDPEKSRSHLRASVLIWLADQMEIDDRELELVAEIAVNENDRLNHAALQAMWSRPFSETLHRHGLLARVADVLHGTRRTEHARLESLVARLKPAACAALLCETSRHMPEEVSTAAMPFACDLGATAWAGVIMRCVFLAGPTAGAKTVELFCAAANTIADSAIAARNGAPVGGSQLTSQHDPSWRPQAAVSILYAEHSIGVLALSTLANRASSPAVKAVCAWLMSVARICEAQGISHIFAADSPLSELNTGLEIFDKAASRDPAEFAETLTPVLLGQLHLAASETRWYPAGEVHGLNAGLRYDEIVGYGSAPGGLSGEVFGALRAALRHIVTDNAELAHDLIGQLVATDLIAAHHLAGAALSDCAAPFLPAAMAWVSQRRVRGLNSGMTAAWCWGEVLAHLAEAGTADDRDAAIGLAIAPYRSVDLEILASYIFDRQSLSDEELRKGREAKDLATEQIVALSLITRRAGSDAPEAVRDRLEQLQHVLGPVPDTPNPPRSIFPLSPPSPIPDSEVRTFGDAAWTAAIRAYTIAPSGHPGIPPVGGVVEVAAQLQTAATAEPGRFAALMCNIGSEAHPSYIHGVILAIMAAAQDVPERDIKAVLRLVRMIWSWSDPQFNQPLSRLISAIAGRDIPDDIIGILPASP